VKPQIQFLNECHSFKVVNKDFVSHHCDDVLKVHFDADDFIEEFQREECLLSSCVPDNDFSLA